METMVAVQANVYSYICVLGSKLSLTVFQDLK